MKKSLILGSLATLAITGIAAAEGTASAVTSAISGVAGDASTGVTAGVTIGAVVFGGRVVWNAIKSMAH